MLENDGGIEKLFFELASESRLSILREISKHDGKMREIARKLDLTTTETFRQLQRLSQGLLVEKQPEGTYTITEYGRFILQLSVSFEFIFNNRQYFSTHDFRKLPYQFLNRIGELSQASLIMNTMDSMKKFEKIFGEAEQYAWGLREGSSIESIGPMFSEQLRKGVKFKDICPESELATHEISSEKQRNVESRGLPLADIPATIMLTEKEGAICLRFINGRMDYACFVDKNPVGLNWIRDLFLYYWDKGKRV
jgi:predicted transcriptional regulator